MFNPLIQEYPDVLDSTFKNMDIMTYDDAHYSRYALLAKTNIISNHLTITRPLRDVSLNYYQFYLLRNKRNLSIVISTGSQKKCPLQRGARYKELHHEFSQSYCKT